MSIIEDLITAVDTEAQLQDIRMGPYWTAVLTRSCGLATVVPTPYRHGIPSVSEAGFLSEKSVRELVYMAHSNSALEASVGMATINSLLEIDERSCVELNAADVIVEQGQGRKVAVVGHFPFVERLRHEAGELWVIERYPREGDVPESEAMDCIPRADVVAITGSAFVNHTIEHLLALCDPGTFVIVLGPTTPLSPVLFDYGVDVISGTRVTDPELVLRYVSQGATFRQMKGVKLLTMKRSDCDK
ncbi:MAG: DUF364 domain-containing protein [Dehalococcoidia bacterium]|nr:MAG: DUF364 domain-containing protein [Dehalococcoidia bacterium]